MWSILHLDEEEKTETLMCLEHGQVGNAYMDKNASSTNVAGPTIENEDALRYVAIAPGSKSENWRCS